MDAYNWIATAAFGLEGLVSKELSALGLPARAENGGARFSGSHEDALRAQLWLRTADRVLLEVASFEARSFAELFDQARELPWERFLSRHCRFPVTGSCARSALMSVRDCQSILKKAIVERLREKYSLFPLPEDGESVAVSFQIHADRVRLSLDASGTALNRRGYRTWNGEAPLRETLAAALVDLSPWRPGMPLADPMCGTGTLVIEAAMRMAGRAPGLTRSFAMESWPDMPVTAFAHLREEAEARFDPARVAGIEGSDIDPDAIELARRHLKAAGLAGRVPLSVRDMRDCRRAEPTGLFLTNPPYVERLSDRRACESLYRDLGAMFRLHPGWSLCAISSHPGFERCLGRRADKKRRFYNGRLECEFMTFYGKRTA